MIHQQYPSELLERAVSEFAKLPGIGRKTALRLVLWMLRQEDQDVEQFAKAIGLEVMYEEEYIDVPCKQLLDEMIEMSESMNAGRSFVKYDYRGWDVIVTVKRQKKKGNDEETNPQGEA